MGFMDALKGANMNFGTVDSPDFMASYLTSKGDHFMITGAQAGTYEFTKEDIKEFKVVIAGDEFIKWKMVFKDGKIAIITSGVKDPSGGSGVSMAPIERFFGDLLVTDSSSVSTFAETRGEPSPCKREPAASEVAEPVKEKPNAKSSTKAPADDVSVSKPSKLLIGLGITGWLFLLAAFIQMLTSPGLDIVYGGGWFPMHRYTYASELIFGGDASDGTFADYEGIFSPKALIAWILTMIILILFTIAVCMNFVHSRKAKNSAVKLYFIAPFIGVAASILIFLLPVGISAGDSVSLYITYILSAVFLLLGSVLSVVCGVLQGKNK